MVKNLQGETIVQGRASSVIRRHFPQILSFLVRERSEFGFVEGIAATKSKPEPLAWDRAFEFINELCGYIWVTHRETILTPTATTTENGGILLNWASGNATLVVMVPANKDEAIRYQGEAPTADTKKINGRIEQWVAEASPFPCFDWIYLHFKA